MAIVAGVAIAAPPVAGFNLWLNSLVERQSREELELSAKRSLSLAESRIATAVATLDALAAKGVDSCRSQHIDALRHATFAAIPVKELSVIAPDGRTLCADSGLNEPRRVIASEKLAAGQETLLEVVRIGERPERVLRLRRPGGWASNGLAATIPVELLTTQISAAGGPPTEYTRMTTRGGQIITEVGVPPRADGEAHAAGTRKSDRYAIDVVISMPREQSSLSQGDLRALGTMLSSLLACLILGLALLLPKRSRDNPVAELERALKAGSSFPITNRLSTSARGGCAVRRC